MELKLTKNKSGMANKILSFAPLRLCVEFLRCKFQSCFLLFAMFFCGELMGQESILLRDNLRTASPGDYIVVAQDKNYIVLHINSKQSDQMTIEEISVPISRFQQMKMAWKLWAEQGALGSTNWVLYNIDLKNGAIGDYYSVKKKAWSSVPQSDIFLSKLLLLKFYRIPDQERKKIGVAPSAGSGSLLDKRPLWQPKMVFEGREIAGVKFSAWRAIWPKDSSQLSGKQIEVFIPEENQSYPTYFPYWLEVSGFVGKAKLRMVDGGRGMHSSVSLP
jgi:hypothetical protein